MGLSGRQIEELLGAACDLRRRGMRLLRVEADDRIGRGLVKVAARFEVLAGERRLRVVREDDEVEELVGAG